MSEVSLLAFLANVFVLEVEVFAFTLAIQIIRTYAMYELNRMIALVLATFAAFVVGIGVVGLFLFSYLFLYHLLHSHAIVGVFRALCF